MATQRPLISSSTGQFQRLPTSDTLDLSTLGTGTPDNTKFLRGDGSWAVPPSEATSLALSSLTAATGANTIASGDNAQTWQWALTSILKSALTVTESVASTNGGSNQVLVDIATLAMSTATPFRVTARGTEALRVDATGAIVIPVGASTGKVLTSDATGVASWQTPTSVTIDTTVALAIALG